MIWHRGKSVFNERNTAFDKAKRKDQSKPIRNHDVHVHESAER